MHAFASPLGGWEWEASPAYDGLRSMRLKKSMRLKNARLAMTRKHLTCGRFAPRTRTRARGPNTTMDTTFGNHMPTLVGTH